MGAFCCCLLGWKCLYNERLALSAALIGFFVRLHSWGWQRGHRLSWWGLLPLFLTEARLPFQELGIIAAIYPGVWGTTQLLTGALSDRWGRRLFLTLGPVFGLLHVTLLFFTPLDNPFPYLLGLQVLAGISSAILIGESTELAPSVGAAWKFDENDYGFYGGINLYTRF